MPAAPLIPDSALAPAMPPAAPMPSAAALAFITMPGRRPADSSMISVIGCLTAGSSAITARACSGRPSSLDGCSCRSSQRLGPSLCISAASAGVAPQVTRFSSIRS